MPAFRMSVFEKNGICSVWNVLGMTTVSFKWLQPSNMNKFCRKWKSIPQKTKFLKQQCTYLWICDASSHVFVSWWKKFGGEVLNHCRCAMKTLASTFCWLIFRLNSNLVHHILTKGVQKKMKTYKWTRVKTENSVFFARVLLSLLFAQA